MRTAKTRMQRASTRIARRRFGEMIESLESRRLLTVNTIGALHGRAYFSNQHLDAAPIEETLENDYNFSLATTAQVQVQLSRLGQFSLDSQFCSVILSNTDTNTVEVQDLNVFSDEVLTANVPAGNYSVAVETGELTPADYTLAINADTAGASPLFGSGTSPPLTGFHDTAGKDFGALSEVPGSNSNKDFVGFLDGSDRAGADLFDVNRFNVPTNGAVKITMNGLQSDANGGSLDIVGELFLDSNHDGIFLNNEIVRSQEITSPSSSIVFNNELGTGRYAFVLIAKAGVVLPTGGSNYNLNIDYTADDNAGNFLSSARNIGDLTNKIQTFSDYLSSQDTEDWYKFTLAGGGPFEVQAHVTGIPSGANFDTDIMEDLNNDGTLTANEVLASGTQPGNLDENNAVAGLGPGTFYVRVKHVLNAGEGTYSIALSGTNLDVAGNTLATAKDLGNLFGRKTFDDSLSPTDSADIFKFTLPTAATLTIAENATTAGNTDAIQLIRDFNGNNVVDAGEILTVQNASPNARSIVQSLTPGTYFVDLERAAGTPAYHLEISADTGSNTLAGAGTITTNGINEFVGPADAVDVYKFIQGTTNRIGFQLAFLTDPVSLQVGPVVGSGGSQTFGAAIINKIITSNQDVSIIPSLSPGTYFVRIESAGSQGTNYFLAVGFSTLDNAGNSPEAASDLGVLGATVAKSDFVGDGTPSFMNDGNDLYRFTLGNNGPFALTSKISGLSANADIELYRDDNLDQHITADELLASSNNTGTTTDQINQTLSTPGIYYLRVFRVAGASTNYTLSVGGVSTDKAGNSLADAFNLGTLGAGLNVSDQVGAIDPDDFYQFTLARAARIQTNLSGAKREVFTEIIRDTNNNLNIDSGETIATSANSSDASDPLALALAAGRYFVRVRNTAATLLPYTLNIITQTSGTFALRSPQSTVKGGSSLPLSLAWTVPNNASWHTLTDIEIRLIDDQGVAMLLKFDEASGTFALFLPGKNKFSASVTPGDPVALTNHFVTINMHKSSVKAASSTSSTVRLTVNVTFGKKLAGRSLRVEAAAKDDLGHAQKFGYAGTVNVE